MKNPFHTGDTVQYTKVVEPHDVAAFHGEIVHPVCATFTLAREVEWTTRLFVLKMKEDDEEGIGTFLTIDHKGPAFVGEEIVFTGRLEEINGNEIICSYDARVGGRLIAVGKTGQKIFKKEKIRKLLGNE